MDRRKFLGLAGGAAAVATVPIQAKPETLEDTIIAIEAMTKPKGVALKNPTTVLWPGDGSVWIFGETTTEYYEGEEVTDFLFGAEHVEFFDTDS